MAAQDTIVVNSSYCIDEPYLYMSDLDKSSNDGGIVLSIPHGSTYFKVPSIKLINRLQQRGFDVEDRSGGVVEIKRNCYERDDLDFLHVKILEEFTKRYPKIEINSLHVSPSSKLPYDFRTYIFQEITKNTLKLQRDKATFLVKFLTNENKVKSFYFQFEIDAKVPLYRARNNLLQGRLLSKNDYEEVLTSFKNIPHNALLEIKPDKLVVKFYIKKGNILTKNRLEEKPTIQKGDTISAILQDNALSMKLEVKALESGSVGDTIRVRAKKGKVFSGVVKSEKRVLLK